MPRKICCTVETITDHGGGVYTVDLVPATAVPSFRAGQFLHLTVDDYDPAGFWPESRVFSIASSPANRGRIRICYSVKGRYTRKMAAILKAGSEVWIKLPYGEFVIDDSSDATLIAGGTGISAFTAFLEALAPGMRARVLLVYGVRAPALLLFRDTILKQLAAVPNFRAVFYYESADGEVVPGAADQPTSPPCFTGRIALDPVFRLSASDDRLKSSIFYLSGPPVMLRALSADLKSRAVPPDRIRTDAWE